MKTLNGQELADYITERQAKQVRALRQAHKIIPKLAIIQTSDNPVIDTYVRMKKRYGAEILVEVEVHKPSNQDLLACIEKLNQDDGVHGIIIQLPLDDESQIEAALNAVMSEKDVDGLNKQTAFTPATAMAINWLLVGYNVELIGQKIAIVGNGRLVGAPLAKLWKEAGYSVTIYDEHSKNTTKDLKRADIIVSAAGVPALITSSQVKSGAVIVDAATSAEHGKIIGDVADEVRQRSDITITPERGGVGPLTVVALFDNVLRAAQAKVAKG